MTNHNPKDQITGGFVIFGQSIFIVAVFVGRLAAIVSCRGVATKFYGTIGTAAHSVQRSRVVFNIALLDAYVTAQTHGRKTEMQTMGVVLLRIKLYGRKKKNATIVGNVFYNSRYVL